MLLRPRLGYLRFLRKNERLQFLIHRVGVRYRHRPMRWEMPASLRASQSSPYFLAVTVISMLPDPTSPATTDRRPCGAVDLGQSVKITCTLTTSAADIPRRGIGCVQTLLAHPNAGRCLTRFPRCSSVERAIGQDQ